MLPLIVWLKFFVVVYCFFAIVFYLIFFKQSSFKWYDMGVGAYIDTHNADLYIILVPMFVVKIKIKGIHPY